MPGRLMLLDTASLYYRAFFGLPDSLRAPDGTAVNALRGVLDFTSTLATTYRPDTVVACWDDDWRPQWRVDLLPSYKSQRLADPAGSTEDTPDLLVPQVPLIAEALELAGIPVVGAPEAEADDVIGTLVNRWDGPVDVVTGDRDLFQVIDDADGARVLYTARGVGKHEIVDAAWVRTKYGVEPGSYVDLAVLRGDASDGLPGVPGIGDKTAATLLEAHGDLDGILAAADDDGSGMRPRIRQSLRDSREYIAAAREVVAVRRTLALPQIGRPATPQSQALREFGARWAVTSPVERLLVALSR